MLESPPAEYLSLGHLEHVFVSQNIPPSQVVPSQIGTRNRNTIQNLMYECQEAVFNVFLGGFIADRSKILRYYRSTGKIHIIVV